MSMRKIVVDGHTYEWFVAADYIRVRRDRNTNYHIPFPSRCGRPARAHWNDGSVAAVTPGIVADLIRKHEGRPPAQPKVINRPPRRKHAHPFGECVKMPPKVIGRVFSIYRLIYDWDAGVDVRHLVEIHADPAIAKERVSLLNGDSGLTDMQVIRQRLDDWCEGEKLRSQETRYGDKPHPFPDRERKHWFLTQMRVVDLQVRNAIIDLNDHDSPRYVTEEMPLFG